MIWNKIKRNILFNVLKKEWRKQNQEMSELNGKYIEQAGGRRRVNGGNEIFHENN